jgi:dihydrolipoamide dehydrogenase
MKTFDVIVIGGGPGGYTAAVCAAQLGARVAVIEKDSLGGTCLNRGCIPTKSLLHSVHVLETVKRAKEFGVMVEEKGVVFEAIIQRKEKVLTQLRNGLRHLLKSYGIEVIKGNASFISPANIRVGDEVFSFKKCIIATGSIPSSLPGVTIDGEYILSSDHLLAVKTPPASLLIIGGGVIGVEFACIFQALGTKVTIIEAMPSILPAEDREICRMLERILKARGIEIHTRARVEGMMHKENGVEVTFTVAEKGQDLEAKRTLWAERVLVATGRKPCIQGLGLEEIGIKCEKGRILVNERMETNIQGIYAIGDVVGPPFLAHKACAEAMVAAQNAMGKEVKIDYSFIPSCIFTLPEVASVGLTEKEAKEKGHAVKIGKFPFAANGRAVCAGETKGFVKVILDKNTDAILGIHILGPQATELIFGAALLIKTGYTPTTLERILFPHPTLSEGIFQAILASAKRATDLPKQ